MQDCVHQQNDKTCESRKEEKEKKKPQESDLTHSRMPNQAERLLQQKEQLRGSEFDGAESCNEHGSGANWWQNEAHSMQTQVLGPVQSRRAGPSAGTLLASL